MDLNKRQQEEQLKSKQDQQRKNDRDRPQTDGFRYDYDDSSDLK